MEWWLGYAAVGAAAGFFAGLPGIGGGAIMVPGTQALTQVPKKMPVQTADGHRRPS